MQITTSTMWETLKYMNLLLHLYTLSKCQIYNKWTVHELKCLSSFLFFRFPSNWERVYKIEYKEKQCQGYLSYFFGVLWRIFLLLRANRLYLIFNTGLKKMASSIRNIFMSSSTRSTGFGSICHEPCPITNLSYYLFLLTGRSPHFRFGVPANHLAYLSFLPVSGDPSEVTKYQHLLVSPLWPTFFLNGHSLMACYC